jgi:hypothetical protein
MALYELVRNYQQGAWLTVVTFLTVGYGDIYPISICGRVVVCLIGMIGIGVTALSVTIFSQKMEETHAEKYVFHFTLVQSRATGSVLGSLCHSVSIYVCKRRKKSKKFGFEARHFNFFPHYRKSCSVSVLNPIFVVNQTNDQLA